MKLKRLYTWIIWQKNVSNVGRWLRSEKFIAFKMGSAKGISLISKFLSWYSTFGQNHVGANKFHVEVVIKLFLHKKSKFRHFFKTKFYQYRNSWNTLSQEKILLQTSMVYWKVSSIVNLRKNTTMKIIQLKKTKTRNQILKLKSFKCRML